jgi:hypothetical protein
MALISQPVPKPLRAWRSGPGARISTLAPFALALYLDLRYSPLTGTGIFSKPPELVGLPAGVWLQISVLSWAAVGAWIVWTTRSRLASALGLFLFTLPSVFGLVLLPAIILIWQNLGSR